MEKYSSQSPSILSLLNEAPWAQEAKNTLELCTKMDMNYPVFLFLRHSHRDKIKTKAEVKQAPLTETGKRIALAFGKGLPSDHIYHIYSSPIPRCLETAILIEQGLKYNQIECHNHGVVDILHYQRGKSEDWDTLIDRDMQRFLNNWLAGFYPLEIAEPSLQYAKETSIFIQQLHETKTSKMNPRIFNLFITHDFNILVLRFHFCGISPGNPPNDWWDFLRGFFIQLTPNEIKSYDSANIRTNPYPYWWKH